MDKIKRATEIHRRMTPHQMALRIVEMEDESVASIDAMNMAREVIDEGTAKLEEYNAKLDWYDKRITELQDALELAEEAVLAKQQAVPEGWQLVPINPVEEMISEVVDAGTFDEDDIIWFWSGMLAAAPKPQGCASWNNAPEKPEHMTMERFVDQYCCVFNASDEPKPQGGAA